MPLRGLNEGPALEPLGVEECWRLLGTSPTGRICFSVDHRVQVLLAAVVVHRDRVHFRASAFGTVARRVLSRPVTLEVDDLQPDQPVTWAVTMTGDVQPVEDAATLASLWTPVRPVQWDAGQSSLWVALTPDDVQGHRVRR